MIATEQWEDDEDERGAESVHDGMAVSRRRFLWMVSLSLCIPGSFMLFGLLNRQPPEKPQDSIAPLSPEQKAIIAERKVMIARGRKLHTRLQNLYKEQEWQDIITEATTYLQKQENYSLSVMRLEAYFYQHQYNKAIIEYQKLFPPPFIEENGEKSVRADNTKKVYETTMLALAHRDDAYRALCQSWMETATVSPDAIEDGNNIAWATCLRPGGLQDYKKAESFAQAAVDFVRKEVTTPQTDISKNGIMGRRSVLANYLNTLALVYYREGKFPEAMKATQESEGLNPDVSNWFLLLHLHKREGNKTEAALWQKKLKDYFETTYGHDTQRAQRYEILLLTQEICPEVFNM
jgi:tetratricopeptide (TPR) repeat protein